MCAVSAALNPSAVGLSGWICEYYTPSSNVCSTWGGVSCNTTGNVTAIALAGLGLSGTLPSSIGLLVSLTSLALNDNHILGPVPSSVAALPILANLEIANNAFTGTIPSVLCQNTHLSRLTFAGNSLECYFSCLSTVTSHNYGIVGSSSCSSGN